MVSSSTVTRPKVLCLGVSYADIHAAAGDHPSSHNHNVKKTTKANYDVATTLPVSTEGRKTSFGGVLTADDAIKCVEEKVLNQMDGRDLTRVLATEELCQVHVYCVSQEKGAIYRHDRHLDGNFNRPSFVKKLQKAFSEGIQFHQIILDYFWIPTGWDVHHWSRSFFESVLISFAKSKLIPPSSPTTTATGAASGDRIELYRSGIYLPFCFHCFQAVISYATKLTAFYNISFLRKTELRCMTLWAGTQTINRQRMQQVLGKRIDQEEIYCTFTARHIKEMECSAVGASKEELINIASSLEDFPDVRFIILEPLDISDQTRTPLVRGRFLGLTAPHRVRRGFRSGEKLGSLSPNRPVRSSDSQSLSVSATVTSSSSTSSSSLSGAARKRKVSSSCVNSPRKSPRLELRRQSPDSVLSVSFQSSSSLPPKVLFPPVAR